MSVDILMDHIQPEYATSVVGIFAGLWFFAIIYYNIMFM